MRRSVFTAASVSCFLGVFAAVSANAHPGVEILTTGSDGPRTAMTSGMSFEQTNGVHLFRGRKSLDEIELLGADTVDTEWLRGASVLIVKQGPHRSFRRLRTQGFYSGIPYPSRRYTKGFYSGR